ncbi:HD domain-containing phosphohydrolase [Natranaerofaba carboxydovora]|uniref:HD domain-containing phosphohydrolase n=1 Tax=Natranaerofaba carboxydovora TaxID=2742683 RepID=UPI001F143DF2|nr:HD domain-containing phosphohydrolase [Natranaerofaba carboxydovora]UMZ73497.1 Cyclic di-GMP phosphodiesterase response regulator RpfG [Natranaerofaba carboxydovora]
MCKENQENILIIDDTPSYLKLLINMLRERGYKVQGFQRGSHGLKAATKNPPDLILLDINMPEMSGFEVCEHLKADENLKNIPVIFISSLIGTKEKVKAFDLGAVDYLTKPFQLDEAKARIETHLNMRKLQKQLEEKNQTLRENEAKFRAISDMALDAVIMIDENAKTVYWNTAAEKMFGYKRTEVIGIDPHDFIMPEKYKTDYIKGFKSFVHTGHGNAIGKVLELTAKNKNGEEFPIEIALSSINMGDKYWASAIIRDISERKNAEEVINEYAREIDKKNRYLEEMVQEKVEEISNSQIATIIALANLAESRDDETGQHIERTQSFCFFLATELKEESKYEDIIDEAYIENLTRAAPLHDIGKVGVSDNILLKPGKLTTEEFEIIKSHTTIGAKTLKEVKASYPNNEFINMGINIARSHHERWNGSGYPDGLSKDQIPLSARIMAVADVYDALRTKRVYKPAFSHEKAFKIINEEKGKHFDPVIVDAFNQIHEGFEEISDSMSDNV